MARYEHLPIYKKAMDLTEKDEQNATAAGLAYLWMAIYPVELFHPVVWAIDCKVSRAFSLLLWLEQIDPTGSNNGAIWRR